MSPLLFLIEQNFSLPLGAEFVHYKSNFPSEMEKYVSVCLPNTKAGFYVAWSAQTEQFKEFPTFLNQPVVLTHAGRTSEVLRKISIIA